MFDQKAFCDFKQKWFFSYLFNVVYSFILFSAIETYVQLLPGTRVQMVILIQYQFVSLGIVNMESVLVQSCGLILLNPYLDMKLSYFNILQPLNKGELNP